MLSFSGEQEFSSHMAVTLPDPISKYLT